MTFARFTAYRSRKILLKVFQKLEKLRKVLSGSLKINFTSGFPTIKRYGLLLDFDALSDTLHPGGNLDAYILYRWHSK